MKKVLLVDTNFSSFPIYNALVDAGHQVFVVGQNPLDFLARSTPGYVQADYSDVSALKDLVSELGVDAIVPGCNDLSYRVCAELMDGEAAGLDSPAITDLLFNKRRFRRLCMDRGLPTPQLFEQGDQGWPLDRPLVVKPVDSFSGKGISILHEPTTSVLESALDEARKQSRLGEALVEEYVEGQLFSHSAFIRGGRISAEVFVREYGSVNPLVVDVSYVERDFPEHLAQQLRASIEDIAGHLTICDGLMHTQFISNGERVWMIEITRRCPGDLYSRLVQHATGMDYPAAYAGPFVGDSEIVGESEDQGRLLMRHTITQGGNCGFLAISFKLEQPFDYVPVAISGDRLAPSPAGRVGLLFVEAEDKDGLEQLVARTREGNLYELERLREVSADER